MRRARTRAVRNRSLSAPAQRAERGANLVEFALVVPIFLLLVMGIIDFSMAFNDYNRVRSGVAEATRQGVVANFSAAGCAEADSSSNLVCITKDRIGLDPAGTRVKILLPDGTYDVGDPLRVCAMQDVDSITGMFDVILDARVATSSIDMRIEKLDDADPVTDLEETPLSGESWSWCT
ncbi:MAG: TadE family protein [Acidimicrobiales bacterium]